MVVSDYVGKKCNEKEFRKKEDYGVGEMIIGGSAGGGVACRSRIMIGSSGGGVGGFRYRTPTF